LYTGSACKLSFNLLYSLLSIFCTGCACQLLLKTMMMMMMGGICMGYAPGQMSGS